MSNYYDIDDIIAEEQWISVKVLKEIHMGSQFDTDFDKVDQNIKPNHKMRVPFWFGAKLIQLESNDEELGMVDIPEMFSEEYQKRVLADPTIENLQNYSNYYYELGIRMVELLPRKVQQEQFEGSLKLSKVLKQILVSRAKNYIFKSDLEYIEDIDRMQNSLTSFENKVFNIGRKISEQYRIWKEESINKRTKQFMRNKRIKF